MRRLFWIIAGSLLLTAAQAASFDCTKAKSDLENSVCSNQAISTLDEKLAERYSLARGVLSDEGKKLLKESQLRWIKYAGNVCFKFKNTEGGVDCLKTTYSERISDMDSEAIKIGPFLFSRIDYYYSKEDDKFGRPYQGKTSYPRIDNPATDTELQWNRKMARSTSALGDGYCDVGPGDVGTGFSIKSATENLISAEVGNWFYCHGAAHGYGASHSITYILKPELHQISVNDVFSSEEPKNSQWRSYLTDASLKVLHEKEPSIELNRSQVEGVVTNIKSWTLAKDHLEITINPYEILSYADGTIEVEIPWQDLREFLQPSAPISK